MKKKGFTLIELLAVIVILGIVMAIAIPGINMVINNTKKNSFAREAQLFVSAARNKVRAEEVKVPNNPSEVTIISLNALEMDKGGTTSSFNSPWNYNRSYVLIHNEGTSGEPKLVYYIALEDEAYNGINLTNVEGNLELVDGETSITNIGYEYLPGSPTGTTSTGTFTFYPLTGITTAHVYLGAYTGETGGSLPETEDIQYINATPAENATACQINGNDFTHFTDKRDGKEYPVTKIGNQCWMAEDLRYTTPSCLSSVWNTTRPHDACLINGGTGWDQNEVKYQWEVANAVCPTGSHLPSDDEWKTLERTLGMSETEIEKNNDWRGTNEGQKLKAIQYNGTNTVGFNAKLSGYREWNTVALVRVETRGYWWSSSPSGNSASWRTLYSTNILVNRNTSHHQSSGFSARCLLDN